jgi:hypothetical protein
MPPKVSEGKYKGVFVGATATEANGKEFLSTVWHLPTEDCERVIRLYLTHAAMKWSAATLEKLGFNGDLDNPDIAHKEQNLVCRHEAYDKKNGDRDLAEKWDFEFNSSSRPALPQLPPDRKTLLAQRIKDAMAQSKSEVTPATDTKSSDIPF